MPDQVRLFYPNCTCCGSASGSGSGSCACYFFNEDWLASLYGTGSASPINDGWGDCPSATPPCSKTGFVLTLYMNYNGCGSKPVGSCGSGSSGSASGGGPSTGGDFEPTGSGSSGSCLSTCPSCCDIFLTRYEFNLVCSGDCMFTDNLDNPTKNCTSWPTEYAACKGAQPDCNWAWICRTANSATLNRGYIGLAIDGNLIFLPISNPSLVSCSPLVVTGSGDLSSYSNPNFGGAVFEGGASISDCLINCFGGQFFGNDGIADLSCVTYTWALTEA